jgi:type I restriction enzyme, S subunit
MSEEVFIKSLDALLLHENGIDTIQQSILRFAVRGKLVAQDITDNSVEELIKQTKQDIIDLWKNKEISKPKPTSKIEEEDIPHGIPSNWKWARMGDLVAILDSRRKPIKKAHREARIRNKSQDQLYPYYGATQQAGWIDNYLFDEELLLLGEDGAPFYKPFKHVAYVVSGRFWVNNHAHALRGIGVLNKYLCYVLNQCSYEGFVSGMTRLKLTQTKMVDLLIPVPPLIEQREIVDKVEFLLRMCDEIEEKLFSHNSTLESLSKSLLNAISNSGGS